MCSESIGQQRSWSEPVLEGEERSRQPGVYVYMHEEEEKREDEGMTREDGVKYTYTFAV